MFSRSTKCLCLETDSLCISPRSRGFYIESVATQKKASLIKSMNLYNPQYIVSRLILCNVIYLTS